MLLLVWKCHWAENSPILLAELCQALQAEAEPCWASVNNLLILIMFLEKAQVSELLSCLWFPYGEGTPGQEGQGVNAGQTSRKEVPVCLQLHSSLEELDC